MNYHLEILKVKLAKLHNDLLVENKRFKVFRLGDTWNQYYY